MVHDSVCVGCVPGDHHDPKVPNDHLHICLVPQSWDAEGLQKVTATQQQDPQLYLLVPHHRAQVGILIHKGETLHWRADTADPAQAFSHLSQDLGCGGLAGRVVVLVDGLGGLISGLSDHRCHGGCVDVGEDAASHPLHEVPMVFEDAAGRLPGVLVALPRVHPDPVGILDGQLTHDEAVPARHKTLFSIGVVDRRDDPANDNKPSSFVQIIPGSFEHLNVPFGYGIEAAAGEQDNVRLGGLGHGAGGSLALAQGSPLFLCLDVSIHKCLSVHDVLASDINPAGKAKSQSSSGLHSID